MAMACGEWIAMRFGCAVVQWVWKRGRKVGKGNMEKGRNDGGKRKKKEGRRKKEEGRGD
jgi:hypothetical protein